MLRRSMNAFKSIGSASHRTVVARFALCVGLGLTAAISVAGVLVPLQASEPARGIQTPSARRVLRITGSESSICPAIEPLTLVEVVRCEVEWGDSLFAGFPSGRVLRGSGRPTDYTT